MNYHPNLAGVYRMSPLCAHGEDLHSPFIGIRLPELSPRDTRHWGPFRAGFRPPAPVTAPASRLVASSVLPAQLSSFPRPRSQLQHHGWWPPACRLPSSLLSLSCACHPPPLLLHRLNEQTGQRRNTIFQGCKGKGKQAWKKSSLRVCYRGS